MYTWWSKKADTRFIFAITSANEQYTDFNQNNVRIMLAIILTYLFTAMDCDVTFMSYLCFVYF